MDYWICKNVSEDHLRFSENLGKAVAALTEVQKNRLHLYCNVCEDAVQYLGTKGDRLEIQDAAANAQKRRSFGALLCREDYSVVLAIETTGEESPEPSGRRYGFSVLQTSTYLLENSGLDTIRSILEQEIRRPRARQVPVLQAVPLPHSCLEKLEQERMVEPGEDGKRRVLSAYGRFFGLIQEYTASGAAQIFCPQCAERKLRRTLEGRPQAGAVWEKLPLSLRLERLERGLPSNSAYSLILTRRFFEMPLDRYMAAYPEALSRLRDGLRESEAETYGQAAVCIGRLLHQEARREQGKELMRLLATPLVEQGRQRRRERRNG